MKLICHTIVKERVLKGFGKRLARLRRNRGLTQAELGEAAGVSYRVVAYYEQDNAQPPGAILVDLATALEVTTDELLGIKPVRQELSPRAARLRKRFEKLQELPPADQRAVFKMIDGLLATQRDSKNEGRQPDK